MQPAGDAVEDVLDFAADRGQRQDGHDADQVQMVEKGKGNERLSASKPPSTE